MPKCLLTYICCILSLYASSQRTYSPNSVLATGTWAKIGVLKEGVYKVDATMMGALGFTGSISSSSIKLYGNGGAMLPEDNAINRPDDLTENAVEIIDGGDGILSGSDYFIFYAPGPNRWIYDTANNNFTYQKNLYSDTAFYFITLNSSPSKRINLIPSTPVPPNAGINPTTAINSYTDHYAHETDLSNLINSGKEWVGENFSNSFGGTATRNFLINMGGLITTKPLTIYTHCTNRSVGNNAVFTVSLNNTTIQTNTFNGINGGLLDAYATELKRTSIVTTNQTNLSLNFSYQSAASGAQGWLNQFTIIAQRTLAFNNTEALFFRYTEGLQANTIASFSISNSPANTMVWNTSNPLHPQRLTINQNNNTTNFNHAIDKPYEFIAFTNSQLINPIALGTIANQNLHNSTSVNGLIITHPSLFSEAVRLAAFHLSQYGFRDAIITTPQIYNEFASGAPDATGIRDFIKMYMDKAGNTSAQKPQYILLFGAGSFDPKNRIINNKQLVPTYQSNNSIDPLLTYTSDDFFALTNNTDNINILNNAPLSIAVGRLPVSSLTEAKIMVDKIIRYHSNTSLGNWRNELVLLADDKDQNLHLNDAESIATTAFAANPSTHINKLYLDAFTQVSGAGGGRYPAVSDAIVNNIFNGALIFNYSGHGNYLRLTEEAVLSSTEVNKFNNANKLPLFITASCDFAPHDDPTKQSLGATLLHGNANGAIALLTTTRLVFASSNRIMNNNYIAAALAKKTDGQFRNLGESVLLAKNNTLLNNGDVLNSRKFALLGDPAMRLAFPTLNMRITTINGNPITSNDSLQSLGSYRLGGEVFDANNTLQNNFNGEATITIYDKPQVLQTLGNSAESPKTNFTQESSILFSGKATVTNGKFAVILVLPKDINFRPGNGTIRLYAKDSTSTNITSIKDAAGAMPIRISGSSGTIITDKIGPTIQLFLNDIQFKPNGISSENAVLLAKLYDSSGINATGNGIGHDMVAVIDGDERNGIVLNSFYANNTDSYQRGELRFQLPTLSPGKHTLQLKAWDVVNNSNTATLPFEIIKKERLTISAVRNFPNPFSVATSFAFEHNQPNTNLLVEISIVNSAGQLVKRIVQTVNTEGTRNVQINWAGDSNFGRKLGRGMYFYRIIVSADAQQTQSAGQLLLL